MVFLYKVVQWDANGHSHQHFFFLDTRYVIVWHEDRCSIITQNIWKTKLKAADKNTPIATDGVSGQLGVIAHH